MIERPKTFRTRDALILGIIAAVALGVWAWVEWRGPNVHPKNFGEVEKGVLYRSGRLTPAALEQVVREHGIRTVVDLGGYDNVPTQGRVIERSAGALGLTKYEFELEGDGTGNKNAYVAALRVIADPANHPVLVHCAAGSERTGACVLLYHRYIDPRHIDWRDKNAEPYADMLGHGHNPDRNGKMFDYLDRYAAEIGEAFEHGTWLEGEHAWPVDMTPRVKP